MDAERAKLKDKKNIRRLSLKWTEEEEELVNDSAMVLEGLQPHSNLDYLSIKYFRGVKLPKWVGSLYCIPNLVELQFWHCYSCEKLPALGALPFLRDLKLIGMRSVKCLDEGFYYQQEGESSKTVEDTPTLFPSLEFLYLHKMESLEEWVPSPPPYSSFPLLVHLSIKECHKLTSIPYLQICTSLKSLELSESEKLEEPLPYGLEEIRLDNEKTFDTLDYLYGTDSD